MYLKHIQNNSLLYLDVIELGMEDFRKRCIHFWRLQLDYEGGFMSL